MFVKNSRCLRPSNALTSDKEQVEGARVHAEEEWRSKLEERDGQVEDLQGRLLEAERAMEMTEDKLKTVRATQYRCMMYSLLVDYR